MISKKLFTATLITILSFTAIAQDDMLSLLDSAGAKKTHEKVMATFKGSKIINAQSTETVKGKTCDFNITHRFGNIGVESNGGGHTLYGLDNVTDIRFGFDFGITDNLTLGIGRSKQSEMIDVLLKYRILTQTIDNHIPFSLAFYGDMGYDPRKPSAFYTGTATDYAYGTDFHRMSYTSQLIIARKFGWRFSMELLPTYQHRNYVLANINTNNGSVETNDLMSIGGGFRFKFTKRIALICDYFYTFSDFRTNHPDDKAVGGVGQFFNPLAIGLEIETGGHVFHLNFTNASGIIENNFIPNTNDSWAKGGYKFGFNISRVFNLPHKRKEVK